MNIKTAAKAFLIENGLTSPTRTGLEKPTGGSRTPTPKGLSVEDVKNLRENHPKEYEKKLLSGEIKV